MLIGIISDTHDNAAKLLKAIKFFNRKKVKLVFHLGDWVAASMPIFCQGLKCRMISLFGNNPGDIFLMQAWRAEKKWNIDFYNTTYKTEIDDKKIIIYHGDSRDLTAALLGCQKYDAVFTGHTHIAKNEMVGKTLHVNPGTLATWSKGKLNKKHSISIYNTKTNQAKIISL